MGQSLLPLAVLLHLFPSIVANLSRCSWAWLVLLSAFACTAIVDGLILSFGLHILEMMEAATFTTWGTDNPDISLLVYLLPGALLAGMHLYASESSHSMRAMT